MKRRRMRMRMKMRKLAAAPAAGWRMTTRRSRSRSRIPRRTPPRTPPRRLPSWLSDRPLGARTCPRDRIARSTSWCPHPRRPGPASCRRWIPCLPWTRARGASRRGRDGTRSRTREPIDASRREIQKIVSAPGAAWPLRGSRGRPRGIVGPRSPGPRGTSRSWLRSFRRRGYARVKTRARVEVPRKPLENYPTLPRHQILRIFSRWRWHGHHTRRRATTREGPHGL